MNQPLFYPYIIQNGANQEVLYVNYSLDIDKSFNRFVHKHPQLTHSRLRPDLYGQVGAYRNSHKASHGASNLIHQLEIAGYEVIAGGPLLNNYWQTYVIEIDDDPYHVYVGETNYPREKRFQQHIYKFNPARQLLKYDILRLADELCDNQIYSTKVYSLAAEKQKAIILTSKGYHVEGGH